MTKGKLILISGAVITVGALILIITFLIAVPISADNLDDITIQPPQGVKPEQPIYNELIEGIGSHNPPIWRTYKDFNAWWGENRDHATLLALGKVQGSDYFIHSMSALQSGIPAGTAVVLMTSNSWGQVSTREAQKNPIAQANLTNFLKAGGVIIVDMADNDYYDGYRAPGAIGAPSYIFGTCQNATLDPMVANHPIIIGPDGISGTTDDLNNLNIDMAYSCWVAHGNLVDGITLPSDAKVIMTSTFGGVEKPILVEYCYQGGRVIIDTLTKEFVAHQPPGYGYTNVMRNLFSYALSPKAKCAPINQPPVISNLGQFKSDNILPISESSITTESTAVFKAILNDSDNDRVKFEVELRQFHELFTGVYDGGILSPNFVDSGSQVIITREGLVNGQYKWRARTIDSRGAFSDWQEFGTVGNVDFEVKLVPLYTQVLSDINPQSAAWFGQVYANGLGNTGDDPCGLFIEKCGCAITSAVMVLRYYGITTSTDNQDINPLTLNNWFNNNNGYVGNGNLDWVKVSEYSKDPISGIARLHYDGRRDIGDNFGTTFNDLVSLTDFYVNSAKPVIIQNLNFGHFLVVNEKLTNTYAVRDPAWYNTKKLDETATSRTLAIRDYNNQFDGIRLYSHFSGPVDGISFNLASPAEFLVMDPQGRRLGKDPVSNISYNEIPNSSYGKDGISNADTEVPDPPHIVKNIWISKPITGFYEAKVIGTASGIYTFNSLIYDASSAPHSVKFVGTAQKDQITDFNLTFSPDQPEDIAVKAADKILPEAKIFFNPESQTLKIEGIDNIIDPAPTVTKQNNNFIIQDAADNTLTLEFKELKQKKKEIDAELKSLQYNNQSKIILPKTELKFEWSIDKKTQKFKELYQKIEVENQFNIEANYNPKNDETEIKIEKGIKEDQKKERITLPGLVIVKLITQSGELSFEMFTFPQTLSAENTFQSFLASVLNTISEWTSSFFENIKDTSIKILKFLRLYPKLAEVKNLDEISSVVMHDKCLTDNEIVEYDRISQHPIITQPKEVSPVIYVRNKINREVVTSFQLNDVRDSGHPMEVHKCNIYFVREFNSDPKKPGSLQIGQRAELWKYDYQGEKKMLVLLYENLEKFTLRYSPEFRVDSKESYVALIRDYFSKSNYALIIKNLKTLNDDFILPMSEIEKRNPDLVQNISFEDGGWTRDGRYFWADTHYGANTLGFIRIDMETKTFDLFPAPKNVLGGDALNLEKGLITVHPGNVWFGIEQVEQEEKEKRRKQGLGTELYIYNLITSERKFIVKTDEPLYYFKPRWISDSELQYILPNGEQKIYNINEK